MTAIVNISIPFDFTSPIFLTHLYKGMSKEADRCKNRLTSIFVPHKIHIKSQHEGDGQNGSAH